MSKFNEKLVVNNIRSLGIDMIHEANSGHPGIVLGASPIIYTLFAHHMKFHTGYPNWCNRDRFVLSAGHGSAMLYATLFMNGYDYTIDDLKAFRSLDSITPGHPEYNINLGIEMTTGPLGQGLGTAVGMAIAEKYLEKTFNTKKHKIFDYKIYALCGEGDLMEGISYEAVSLASNLKLNNLIVLYDANKITLDGNVKFSFNENIMDRFENMGWNVLEVSNGENIHEISRMIKWAKHSKKPTIIQINTTIGKYSKLENTNKVHGTPLEEDDIKEIKKKLKINDTPFDYDIKNKEEYLKYIEEKNKKQYNEWKIIFDEYIIDKETKLKDSLLSIINNEQILIKLEKLIDVNNISNDLSMREINSLIMNTISNYIPEFIGGSADTVSSTKTYLKEKGDFNSKNYTGKNIYYGIREHAMASSTNGIALSNLRPFASTFLTFADYMKPSIRLSALMDIPSTFIFTHDSINIGQDGPTHQPIEQLGMLRSIPNFTVYRPCDKKELIGCWNLILEQSKPCALIISRNKSKEIKYTSPSYVKYGGYVIHEFENKLDLIILASGTEVNIALSTARKLKEEDHIEARIISVPNLNTLLNQDPNYLKELLPKNIKKYVIEYSNDTMWYQLDKEINLINMKSFGTSAKSEDVIKHFELDEDSIYNKIKNDL
ncbi:MAG: transketolase [Tenericutes bacterium]|nr:transketolase [Mycoplasmatota bacterium]